jgi:murein DD-endopeptidase MepM/ murein hydrolase activator NlpD
MLHYKRARRVSVVWAVLLVVFFAMNFSVGFSASPRRRYHIVKSGESLDSIAKQYRGVSVANIIKGNNLKKPDHIVPGQRLIIPWKGIWHTVREGEYLELIARNYAKTVGINWRSMMTEIKQSNGLYNPDKLRQNQTLFIPRVEKTLQIKIPKKEPQGVWHTIEQYDLTIFRIALNYGEDYGIKWQEMQNKIMQHSSNKAVDPRNLQIGQKIFIPEVKKVLEIEIPSPLLVKKEISNSASITKAVKRVGEFREEKPIFSWPVQGEIVGYFGEKGNEGVDIAVAVGDIVTTPADGVIEWADEYASLGPSIIIKHEQEGFFSSFSFTNYFTNLSLVYKVNKGDEVNKGEPIAEIAASEAVNSIRLHFEVHRKENIEDSVNPLDYLP